ncbi:MAG: hypothetical protein JXA77_18410 [Bacteroidales bacterium]|nr:hypothetical protein [Bacteroidales bacterium]MBN2818159.1 hypothetical protein [Bacteroidales bacterium]
MKFFKHLFWVCVAIGGFTSCNDEPTVSFYPSIGVYQVSGDSSYIYSDNLNLIYITNSTFEGKETLDSGARVYAYFSLVEDEQMPRHIDYMADLLSIDIIPTKPVINITDTVPDSLGFDPIVVEGIKVGLNFLDVSIEFLGFNKKHYVNLVRLSDEYSDTIDLELRHNNNNDPKIDRYTAYISFDISSLENEATDSVIVRFRSTAYDDSIFEKIFTYKY